jgi:hypothetical protein
MIALGFTLRPGEMTKGLYSQLLIGPNVALVHTWLESGHALYVWLEFPHGGGGGHAHLIRELADLKRLLLTQTTGELELYVFREEQFPLRGAAGPELLRDALRLIAPGQWYSIVPADSFYPDRLERLGSGNSHAELEAELSAVFGRTVAIGSEPFDGSGWDSPRAVYERARDVLYVGLLRNWNNWPESHPDPARYTAALTLWDAIED